MRNLALVLACIVCALAAGGAQAKDLTDPKCGCQLSIPDSWTATTQKAPEGSYVVTASNADHTQGIAVYVCANSGTQKGHDDFIHGFEDTVAKHHSTIASRENQKIGDLTFVVLTIPVPNGAGVMNNTAWIGFSGQKTFQIGLYSKVADSAKDPDLLAIIHSFKLTTP